MIPDDMLPHTLTVIDPSESTDGYGDTKLTYEVPPASTRDIAAYVQPAGGDETATPERDAVTWDWTAYTNDLNVTARNRVEWRGRTYRVQGPGQLWETPEEPHHAELRLVAVEG